MGSLRQRAGRDHPHLHADATTMSNEQLEKALRDGELDVAAGTAWLWARAGLAASVDTLFVDEAAGGATDRPDVARQGWGRTVHGIHRHPDRDALQRADQSNSASAGRQRPYRG